jgi:LPS export ABC transporter protein LptC
MWIWPKKIPRVLLALCFLGTVIGLNLPLLGEEHPTVNTSPPTIAPEKQGEMQEVRLTEIQDGIKKWVLTADNADYLKDKDKIYINNVWVTVFGKELDKETDDIIITGDKGFIGVKNRDLTLEGNVHAKTAEYEFISDLVHYDPKTRILTAPGPVKVQGPRLYMEGKKMTVDLRNNKLDVDQHTVTKLQISGNLWKF